MTTTYARAMSSSAAGSLQAIRVDDAMHRGVITCAAETPLAVVARIMAAHRIHSVVVAEPDGPVPWGIVSDLDLVAAACAGELATRTAGEIAGSPGLTVSTDDTLERAAQLMHEYEETHLIVVGPRSSGPVGVLSSLDLADALAELRFEEVDHG